MWFLSIFAAAALTGSSIGDAYPKGVNVHFERITVDDGLSQNSIFSIFQDSKGFMWFGGEGGLNRYDGYTFKVYNVCPTRRGCLSNSFVESMCEEPDRVLWIGTRQGLNRLDLKTDRFKLYAHDPEDPASLSDDYVRVVYRDRQNTLWVGTDQAGLNRYDEVADSFIRYRHDPKQDTSISSNTVLSIFEDAGGVLWVGTANGINRFDRKTRQFTRYGHDPLNLNSLSDNAVQSICEEKPGVLWLGTRNGANRFDVKGKRFAHFHHDPQSANSLGDNNINVVFKDSSGIIWFGTQDGGVSRLEPATGRFDVFRSVSGKPDTLSSNVIRSIYEDRFGVMWFGTRSEGVNKLNRKTNQFLLFRQDPQDPASLNENVVVQIYEDNTGTIWIGTWGGGLSKFERGTNDFHHYPVRRNDPRTVGHNIVRAMFQDHTGTMWFGTLGGGLYRYNRESGVFTHYQHDPYNPQSLSHNGIRCIDEDQQGNLWIGTVRGGVTKLDVSRTRFTSYRNEPDNPNSLSYNEVYSIYIDQEGIIWLGTFGGGLNRLDPQTGVFTRYLADPNEPNSINGNFISEIFEDSMGYLWIGTGASGLNRFDRRTETFKQYTSEDEFPAGIINCILEDHRRNLWISHLGGLTKFNLRTHSLITYTQRDGLQSNEFNGTVCFKNSRQEMFFGGVNGFNVFHPDDIEDNKHPPAVVLTDFKVFNRSIPVGGKSEAGHVLLHNSVLDTNELVLSYLDNVFSFEFAALHYAMPKSNRYAFIMEGLDKEWNYTEASRRYRTYNNLPPGKYIFRVKAASSTGVWNHQGLALRITIVPPFWQTWWFRLLTILGATLAAFGWYRARFRNIETQKKNLEQKVVERTREVVRQAEELEQTNLELEKLSMVASKTANAVIIMDAAGNVEWVNEGFTRMYKMTLEEFTGNKGANLIDACSSPEVEQAIEACIREKKTVTYESSIQLHDGGLVYTQRTITPMLDDQGELYRLIAIDSDITELKTVQRHALEHAHKAGMADVAISTIHNVGNILSSVVTTNTVLKHILDRSVANNLKMANQLLRDNEDNLEQFICKDPKGKMLLDFYISIEETLLEEQHKAKESIDRQAEKIHAISEIINAQRDYVDKSNFFVEVISLERLVEDALIMNSESIRRNRIVIHREFFTSTKVPLQRMKLMQILNNVIINAQEAMEQTASDERVMKFVLGQENGTVSLRISDTGCGIPREHLVSVFNYGFTTKPNRQGVSLHNCANSMSEMKGKMWAESSGVDSGATFILAFPVSADAQN